MRFFFLGHSDDFNFRNFFSTAIKTSQDQNFLTQIEQRLPTFLDLDSKYNRQKEKKPDYDQQKD